MSDSKNILTLSAPEEWVGLRLDKALGSVEAVGSRARAAHLISAGNVLIEGQLARASHKLSLGEKLQVELPEPLPSELQAYDFPLDIVFEDEDIIVLNKPAGLVVHPAAGHQQDTLVNALLHYSPELSMKWKERPGIVHRLDKDTTGLMIVARNDQAHEHLVSQFQARKIQRRYEAVCWGLTKEPEGKLSSWLARHPSNRKRFASLKNLKGHIITTEEPTPKFGKWAVTNYKLLERNTHIGLSLMGLQLETGRTHQIRIHLSELGHPICGDELYGGVKKPSSRIGAHYREAIEKLPHFCLHAAELGFTHPRTEEWCSFQVDWPEELQEFLKLCFPNRVDS